MIKKAALTLCALAAAALPLDPAHAGGINPAFSASLSPDTIGPGSTTMLTFTIDNSESASPAGDLAFSITLPTGVTIATPAAATTDCGGASLVLSAPDGGSTLSLSGGTIGAGEICTVMVNVTSSVITTEGAHSLTSGDLTSTLGNSGTASDDLTVTPDLPGFTKEFSPSPVAIGERTTLTFTFDNSANGSDVEDLSFTDNLPAGLVIANPANATLSPGLENPLLPQTITASPGTSTISFLSNGIALFPSLDEGATETLSVDVVATAAGSLGNVTDDLEIDDEIPAGKAGDVLDVTVPSDLLFTKQFIDDPASPGGTVTLEFTIQNLSRTDSATNIAFTDDLATVLTGLTAALPPSPDPPCGAGSSLTLSAGDTLLTLMAGTLAPEASCTFQVTLNVPTGAAAGAYTNTTSTLTATVGGDGVTVAAASDALYVTNAPTITKVFLDDPVEAGGTTRLEFTITNTSATSMATDIEFVDELTAWLPFPVSVTLPTDPCGAGSTLTLISLDTDRQGLELTGGSLAAGDSCTFVVEIDIPVGVGFATITNTTEPISATVDGSTQTGNTASADLEIVSGVTLRKEFTDDPIPPGGTGTLEFTLSLDPDAPGDATGIEFTDDLGGALTGLVSTSPTQTDICGPGSSISGTSTLTFAGGTLSPGQSCTFSVQVAVPGAPTPAVPGTYTNDTSNVTATISTLPTQGLPGTDNLLVTGLTFTKEFVTNPVIPGGTTILRFTLDNTNGTTPATGIMFTDSLSAVLPGTPDLMATLPPTPDPPCGTGSSLTGSAGLLTFAGGDVPAGQSCSFDVTVIVPSGAANGEYRNLTSDLSATIDGNAVTLPPATDVLTITDNLLLLTKEFKDDPLTPGGTGTLEFTLTNLDPVNDASDIEFTDDLGAVITGLKSTSGTQTGICGTFSEITGTDTLMFTGGFLAAGDSCTFSVLVEVPAGADAGSYPNTTSGVTGTIDSLAVAGDPASDDLVVGALTFTNQFPSGPVLPGGTATLEFTIKNNGNSMVSDIGFTDDLNAVIPGLAAVGTPIADVCGTGSSLAGTGQLNLTGASLLPNGSCTFSVDVLVPENPPGPGSYTNTTSDLFVLGAPVAPPAVADLIIDDVGDDIPNAYTATLDAAGKAWISELLSPSGDVDVYSFTVGQNSTVTVHSSGGLDTVGDLLNDLGGLLNDPVADGNAGADDNFQTTQILGPGTYFVRVSGGSPADVGPYMFHVEVTALPPVPAPTGPPRPDALIGKKSSTLKGNNIYNKSAAGQKITVRGRARKGRDHKWFFAVENDAAVPDIIRVRPAKPNVNNSRWRVRIFRLTGGRTNVTGAFEGQRINESLNPGERIIYQVKAELKFNPVRSLRRTFGIFGRSNSDPNVRDMAESTVRLRP